MRIRAAIFDVYMTLLEVGPPPANREVRWLELWAETFGGPARITLRQFQRATEEEVARRHERARAAGIPYPEVYWPEILEAVVPELEKAEPGRSLRWRHEQVRLEHTVRLAEGAAEVLEKWHAEGVTLGIASNGQPYTLGELGAALRAEGLSMELFEPRLMFWSFEHGFSKPDPHVFRLLGARLAAFGIEISDTLMVGDRADNDVRPALRQGWRGWQLTSGPVEDGLEGGDWRALASLYGRAERRS